MKLMSLITGGIFGTFAVFAQAQEIFTSGTLSQNFDILPVNSSTTPADFIFSNNLTIPGWYCTNTGTSTKNGRVSSGAQTTTGVIYSWGPTGGSDRALGSFTANGFASAPYDFGVQIVNSGSQTIQNVEAAFILEQWRRNTTAASWSMEYLVTNSSGNQLAAAGYQSAGPDVTSPITGSASGLNGNLPANQVKVKLGLRDLGWQPGQYLWIRWRNSQPAASAGLGLDDFTLQLSSGIDLKRAGTVISSPSTIQQAVNAALPGDHIVLHTTTFHENVLVSGLNGTASQPISLEAAPGAQVVIDGADPALQQPTSGRWTALPAGAGWTTSVAWSGTAGRELLTWASRANEKLIAAHHDEATFLAHPRGDALWRSGTTVDLYLADGANPNTITLNIGQAEAVLKFVNSGWWNVTGITFRHGGYAGIQFAGSGVHDIFVEDVTVQTAFKSITTETRTNGSSGITLHRCRVCNNWDFNWEWEQGYQDSITTASDEQAPMRGTGIRLMGQNCQVSECEVAGQWDGMALQGDNLSAFRNLIHHMADDMVELESSDSTNVSFYANVGFHLSYGISVVSDTPGPIYIYRNRVQSRDLRRFQGNDYRYGYALKFGNDWGPHTTNIAIYHNTFDTQSRGMYVTDSSDAPDWSYISWCNNIFNRTDGAVGIEAMGPASTNIWGGNLFSRSAEVSRLLTYGQVDPGTQSTMIALQNTTSEPPGLNITGTSSAHNAGIALSWPDLPGFVTDGQPDVGAWEVGSTLPSVGSGTPLYNPWGD